MPFGLSTCRASVTWVIGARGGGDRVADSDRVVVAADEDFVDDESEDSLLAGGVELVQPVSEAAEEAFESVGELEVGLGVVQLGVKRVELGAQRGLALAQRRGARSAARRAGGRACRPVCRDEADIAA
jgi:hypothetical protein